MKDTVLNLKLLKMETLFFDAITPTQNQQDIGEISSGDEEENIVTNLEKKDCQIRKLKLGITKY